MAQHYPHPSSPAVTAVMRANRKTDTRPEVALRSALHRRGLRFRKNLLLREPGVRVHSDIVFTRQRLAVFVDGCFWHACPDHRTDPRKNVDYWTPKLRQNVERDRQATAALTSAGWTVLRIWEHVPIEEAAATVAETLERGAR